MSLSVLRFNAMCFYTLELTWSTATSRMYQAVSLAAVGTQQYHMACD